MSKKQSESEKSQQGNKSEQQRTVTYGGLERIVSTEESQRKEDADRASRAQQQVPRN